MKKEKVRGGIQGPGKCPCLNTKNPTSGDSLAIRWPGAWEGGGWEPLGAESSGQGTCAMSRSGAQGWEFEASF